MIGLAEFQISTLLHSVSARQGIARRRLNSARAEGESNDLAGSGLKHLLRNVEFLRQQGDFGQNVTCLITDSRRVVPGALFFAIAGNNSNGNHYVEEAVDRGAVAIVSSEPCGSHFPIPYLQVQDVRLALAKIAKAFYNEPDEAVAITGITGTNGKTTVATLTQHLLGGRDQVGMLGSVRYDLGKRTLPSFRTTPESVDTFAMLDQMRRAGCTRAALEVSSHGLVQRRVHGLWTKVAVFLNLTQDHLDYHETMEAYFKAKRLLFTGENGILPEHVVINTDCSYGQRLRAHIPEGVTVTTFGLEGEADVKAGDIHLSAEGTHFTLLFNGEARPVHSPLLGRYNVSNLLAAIAVATAYGEPIDLILDRVQSFPGVAGRMERVHHGGDFNVIVDYAHTDDALRHAHAMLREITPGRILTVFGCGGDRDKRKRPLMAAAAEAGAEMIFITSDNPRTEAIKSIFDDMRLGLKGLAEVRFISDRREAIAAAIAAAQPGDCVLIAGKGHETYQEFYGSVTPFDDRQVARELLHSAKGGI